MPRKTRQTTSQDQRVLVERFNARSQEYRVEAMEYIVDALGLDAVLGILSEVCHAKAEHVLVNWQDRALAALWKQMATRLEKQEVAAADRGLTSRC